MPMSLSVGKKINQQQTRKSSMSFMRKAADVAELIGSDDPTVTTTAGGLTVWSLTLNEWVAILTLIYLSLSVFFLLRRELRGKSDYKNKDRSNNG